MDTVTKELHQSTPARRIIQQIKVKNAPQIMGNLRTPTVLFFFEIIIRKSTFLAPEPLKNR